MMTLDWLRDERQFDIHYNIDDLISPGYASVKAASSAINDIMSGDDEI